MQSVRSRPVLVGTSAVCKSRYAGPANENARIREKRFPDCFFFLFPVYSRGGTRLSAAFLWPPDLTLFAGIPPPPPPVRPNTNTRTARAHTRTTASSSGLRDADDQPPHSEREQNIVRLSVFGRTAAHNPFVITDIRSRRYDVTASVAQARAYRAPRRHRLCKQ